MIIKKRAIITWLLSKPGTSTPDNLVSSPTSSPLAHLALLSDFTKLANMQEVSPNWGLPELVTPSFEAAMKKNVSLFDKIIPQLYQEFSESDECGILLCKGNETLVYGFGGNTLHIWLFVECDGKSELKFYASAEQMSGKIRIGCNPFLVQDPEIFSGNVAQVESCLGSIAHYITAYVAVKKHAPTETIVIPMGTFSDVADTPLEYVEKKK